MHQTLIRQSIVWASDIRPQMTQTISDAQSPGPGVAPLAGAGNCLNGLASPSDYWGPMLGSVEVPPSSSQVTEAALSSDAGWVETFRQNINIITRHAHIWWYSSKTLILQKQFFRGKVSKVFLLHTFIIIIRMYEPEKMHHYLVIQVILHWITSICTDTRIELDVSISGYKCIQ